MMRGIGMEGRFLTRFPLGLFCHSLFVRRVFRRQLQDDEPPRPAGTCKIRLAVHRHVRYGMALHREIPRLHGIRVKGPPVLQHGFCHLFPVPVDPGYGNHFLYSRTGSP